MSKIANLTDSSCDIPQQMRKMVFDIMGFHILWNSVWIIERESCSNTGSTS